MVLAFVFLIAQASAQTGRPSSAPPGFEELPANDPEQKNYLEAKKRATLAIIKASNKVLPARNMIERAYNALASAKIYVSTNELSEQRCASNNNAGFFVNAERHPGIIFICQHTRSGMQRTPTSRFIDRVSQLFVHEAVHLAGDADECFATRFEMSVMIRTSGIKTDGNLRRYSSQCGSQFDNYWSWVPDDAKDPSARPLDGDT